MIFIIAIVVVRSFHWLGYLLKDGGMRDQGVLLTIHSDGVADIAGDGEANMSRRVHMLKNLPIHFCAYTTGAGKPIWQDYIGSLRKFLMNQ